MPDEVVARQIVAMAEEDQRMRREVAAKVRSWDSSVDERNSKRLCEIVERIGWPTRSKVGEQAEHMAWLIAQHADLELQREWFTLMRQEPTHEVCPKHLAYLEDRIRVNDGLPQRYGTQLQKRGDEWEPLPVEDPEELDARRLAVGLEPISDYLALARRALS